MYQKGIKRGLDIIFSAVGLVLLSPVFLCITLAIKTTSSGPVIFKQQRVGKDKKLFVLYKFRTMYEHTPSEMPTHLLEDPHLCITPVGNFLRKSSLDELPQILNILRGDMAIIGPRPALWNQADLLSQREKNGIHNVRPGLTGWAQIHGRDELDVKTKVAFDQEYVENLSFAMDVKCFFKTIISVFRRDGIVEGQTIKKKDDKSR